MGLGLVSGCGLNLRPTSGRLARPPLLHTAAAGKDPWIWRAVTGELPGPHAPSALLELSSLDPGLGARAQGEWRAASIARGSRRTRTGKRSGCITRQCWSSRLSRPGVCEGTPMLCYVLLCYVHYTTHTHTHNLSPVYTTPSDTVCNTHLLV